MSNDAPTIAGETYPDRRSALPPLDASGRDDMTRRPSRFLVLSSYGGGIFLVLFGIGWSLVGRFAPPPMSPMLDAHAVAEFYQSNTNMIRLGLSLVMLACAPMVPFYAALGILIARIERQSPVLAVSQIALGLANVLLFYIPTILWQTAAFRPERDPAVTQALNDAAWLAIMWPFALAAMQNIVVAAAVLSDQARVPVLPRWFGYLNVWTAISLATGAAIPFLKSGPFAWDGLFGFWLPTVCYLAWIATTSALMIRAFRQPDR
jgi:hypothetical protein